MSLIEFQIKQLRNILSASLFPSSQFNLIVGENGSGKTSILEAIYYLGFGRSFKSHINSRVINYNSEEFVVFAKLSRGDSLGIEKQSSGKTRIRINSVEQTSISSLAHLLPLQLINPDTYKLLEGGSKLRRQFLDWGVFHVEPSFLPLWQRSEQIIKQRNASLKFSKNIMDIQVWENELILVAEKIDEIREKYVKLYEPVFHQTLSQLMDHEIDLQYFRGWSSEENYKEVLSRSFQKDRILGYTQCGPHKADLKFSINKIPVLDVLSRGQQKLLVYAMKIAQGKLLQELSNKHCIYLVDDLSAELDEIRRKVLLKELSHLKAQVFVTTVEKERFTDIESYGKNKMFHVKQGEIRENSTISN